MLNLEDVREIKEVKIGTSVKKKIWEQLCALLNEFKNVFAWSYNDMSGLDTNIVQHKFPLKPDYPSIL